MQNVQRESPLIQPPSSDPHGGRICTPLRKIGCIASAFFIAVAALCITSVALCINHNLLCINPNPQLLGSIGGAALSVGLLVGGITAGLGRTTPLEDALVDATYH